MTKVDFYILDQGAQGNRYTLACRIAEKAWLHGHRVLVNTASSDEANQINRLLWTFRDQSFVPHGLLSSARVSLNPILIGVDPNCGDEHDVLINLSIDVPNFFGRFQRVAECVDQNPQIIQRGRDRYRYYRDHGYPLRTYPVGT